MLKAQPEFRTAVRLFFYLFFLVASNVAARTSRDTFLLQGSFSRHLPMLIALTAVLMYLVVRIQALLSRGKSPVALAIASVFLGALSYPAFLPFDMSGLASVVYFVWTEALNSLVAVQFWIVASAVLDVRTGKKLFGIIGAGGAIGGLIAGVALVPLGKKYGVNFLPLGAGAMLLAAIPFALGLRARDSETGAGGHIDGAGSTQWNLRHPYVKVLCLLLIPATIAATLIDYQFKVVSAAAIPDTAKLTAYFGRYYAISNGLNLVFQVFLTGVFLTRFGLLISLVFLPALLFLLALPIPALATFAGAQALPLLVALTFAGRLADQTVKFTIYQSAFQLLWLPVPPLHKAALKMSVEGVLKNGVGGIAGLMIAASAAIFPPSGQSLYSLQTVISGITLLSLAIWIYGAFASRTGYRTYLVQSLENRLIDFSAESVEINSSEIRETVRNALLSGEEGAVAFALDILANQDLAGWEADLQFVFVRASPIVQARILDLARRHENLLDKDYVLALAAGDGPHRLAARVIAARRGYKELAPIIAAWQTEDTEARMVALCCRALASGARSALPVEFNAFLTSQDIHERRAALSAAVDFPEFADLLAIQVNLEHHDGEIRRLALDICRLGSKQILVRSVIFNLADAKTFSAAKNALASFNPLVIQNELESDEYFSTQNPDLVNGIFRYLGASESPEALGILLRRMRATDSRLFSSAGKAVTQIATVTGRPPAVRQAIDDRVQEACSYYLAGLRLLNSANTFCGERTLVQEWLEIAMARWLIGACRIASAGRGLTNIEARFDGRILKGTKRSEFLELMENATGGRAKTLLMAILDSKNDDETIRRLSDLLPESPHLVQEWLASGEPWTSSMAVLTILGSSADPFKRWHLLAAQNLPPLANEIMLRKILAAADYWQNNLPVSELTSLRDKLKNEVNLAMYPTLEKILLLKSVGMFSDISGEDISRLIQISREVEMPADQKIFSAGDEGHELFILLSGQIRIHRDGSDLATLKRGDFLGEMALLDNEPRSADATTISDCKLLSIGQQDFFDVLSGRPEILRGILKLLSGRLRKANEAEARARAAVAAQTS